MIKQIVSLFVFASMFAGTSALAQCTEGYLFCTGNETAKLPHMVASGSFGTLVTRCPDGWSLQTGSLDVSTKGHSVSIVTSSGTSIVPAKSKHFFQEDWDTGAHDFEYSEQASANKTISPSQLQSGIVKQSRSDEHSKVRPVHMLIKQNSSFSAVSPYHVEFRSGTALFNAASGVVIDTKEGTIQASPGSVFALSISFGGVRVLSCGKHPVKFLLHDKQVVVNDGEELFVCNHKPLPFEVTPSDGIGRKSIKLIDLGNNLTGVTSLFSIPSMMRSPQYFLGWTKQGGSRSELSHRLLKTAAAISFARKSPQAFYIAPRSNTF